MLPVKVQPSSSRHINIGYPLPIHNPSSFSSFITSFATSPIFFFLPQFSVIFHSFSRAFVILAGYRNCNGNIYSRLNKTWGNALQHIFFPAVNFSLELRTTLMFVICSGYGNLTYCRLLLVLTQTFEVILKHCLRIRFDYIFLNLSHKTMDLSTMNIC